MSRLGEVPVDAAQVTGSETGGLPRRRVRVARVAEETEASLWMKVACEAGYEQPQLPEPQIRLLKTGGKTVYKITRPDGSVEYRDRPPEPEPAPDTQVALEDALRARGYPVTHECYCIPLGKGRCIPVDEEPARAGIELMSVIPARFLEPEGIRLGHLRPGYLYVFLNGHLWREIRAGKSSRNPWSDEAWMYYEVNLAVYQGLDVRPASLDSAQRGVITLPRRLEGRAPKVEVAYSEVQWRWEYICRLGGMNPDDPRFLPDSPRHASFADIEADDDLRRSRLQEINLSGYIHSDKSAEEVRADYLLPVSQASRENNPESDGTLQTQMRQTLRFLVPPYNDEDYVLANKAMPVLVLHDPLGIADDLQHEFNRAYLEHARWVEETGSPEEPKTPEQGRNRKGEPVEHPPAPRYKKILLARYVKAIIDANPALNEEKDLVDREGYERELAAYEEEKAARLQELELHAGALVSWLEREAEAPRLPLSPDTVVSALLDYQLGGSMRPEQAGSDQTGEGMQRLADYLEWLGQTEAGNAFLARQLESKESLLNQALDGAMTVALKRAEEEEADTTTQPVVSPEGDADAWFEYVEAAYGVTRAVWKALADLLGHLARPWRLVLRSRQATLLGQSASARGEIHRLLKRISLLYGHEVKLERITRQKLYDALRLYEAGETPQVLQIRPRLPNVDTPLLTIVLDEQPLLSKGVEKVLRKHYPAKVFMALQALSLALAWEAIVEEGLGSEQEVLTMLQTALESMNLLAAAGEMYYRVSARREVALARLGRTANRATLGRLGKALVGAKALGVLGAVAGIGASAMGMLRDMEAAKRAEERKYTGLADRLDDSATLNELGVINGVVMLGALALAPAAAGVATLVVVGTVLVEAGLFIAQLVVQNEIEGLRLDSPLQYWLKNCYWGTLPYTLRQIEDGVTVVDYRKLQDDLSLELTLLQQMLYAFRVRLTWIRREGIVAVNAAPERYAKYRRKLVMDVLLPNPGVGQSRVFVRLKAVPEDGRPKVLLGHEVPVRPGEAMAPLIRGVRLRRLEGQMRPDYRKVEPVAAKAGVTLRFELDSALLPEHVEVLKAEAAFDPLGNLEPLVPGGDGVSVEIYASGFDASREYVQEAEEGSVKFVGWAYS